MYPHQMVFCCFVKPVKSFAVMVSILALFCLLCINFKVVVLICVAARLTESAEMSRISSSSCFMVCITRA